MYFYLGYFSQNFFHKHFRRYKLSHSDRYSFLYHFTLFDTKASLLLPSHAINHVSLLVKITIELSREERAIPDEGIIFSFLIDRLDEKKGEERNVPMPRSNRNTGRFCYQDGTACASGRQTAFVSYFLPSRRSKAHVAGDSRLVIRQGNERRRPNDPHRRGGYSLGAYI